VSIDDPFGGYSETFTGALTGFAAAEDARAEVAGSLYRSIPVAVGFAGEDFSFAFNPSPG
jgi:hypothetical protein